MKPTERTIGLLTIFILSIFIIMGVINKFENTAYEKMEQAKEKVTNEQK